MAQTQTLANLITKVRQRADQIGSTTFDDVTELKPWVRASLRQLYDLFCQQDNDWYTTSAPLSLLAGIEAYTVPQDLKRLGNVYALYNGGNSRVKLTEFAYDDFGALSNSGLSRPALQYRLIRNLLYIQPVPTSDIFNAIELQYTPEHRHSLLDYTPIDDVMPSGADEWIVLDVLQKMSVKTRLQNMDDILKSKAEVQARLLNSIRTRSDKAPVMRDGRRPSRMPQTAGNPSGPLFWATA